MLILRTVTERPEVVDARFGELVAKLGHTKDERDCGDCKRSASWGLTLQVSLRRCS